MTESAAGCASDARTVAFAPWDRQMECYLRDRGITSLAAVVCPSTASPVGLVHLRDGSQTELVRELLIAHHDVVRVDPSKPDATLLYFRVKADLNP